jgi:pyruvate dehydrogenase E2 component (dihydrolipoamide acetyltransferase)
MARAAGLSLDGLRGTGRRGRITSEDVACRVEAPARGPVPQRSPVALRVVPGQGAARVPVLLLHGLYDEGRGWRDLPDRLAKAGHPVWVADLPGHGASAPAASLTEALEMLAQALPDGQLRLVGHSAGAVLAALLTERLGARAEGLVLVAPAGLGPRINADFLDGMAAAETPAALARATGLLGAGPLSPLMLEAELARLRVLRPGLAPLLRDLARGGLQQTDIAPLLARLSLPIRAIFGLQDRIIDWQDCASLPPQAAIHLLRGAGHLPQVTDPQTVAALISGKDRDRPL